MIVEANLSIKAEDFFDEIEKSVVYDINQCTNKHITKITPKLNYCKTLTTKISGKTKVEINIAEYDFPKLYKATFTSSKSITTISYIAEKIDGGKIKVSYIEDVKYFKKIEELNFKLMRIFYINSSKKRVTRLFRNIEYSVLSFKN